jgi:hypothetical protein
VEIIVKFSWQPFLKNCGIPRNGSKESEAMIYSSLIRLMVKRLAT